MSPSNPIDENALAPAGAFSFSGLEAVGEDAGGQCFGRLEKTERGCHHGLPDLGVDDGFEGESEIDNALLPSSNSNSAIPAKIVPPTPSAV